MWLWIGGTVLVALSTVSAVLELHKRRLYRTVIGLPLDGLVALLPELLRNRSYTSFRLGEQTADALFVGLVYATVPEESRRGNPPNVGLELEIATGTLRAVHPEGVGLGLK